MPQQDETLAANRRLKRSLAKVQYIMTQTLGLQKLRDLLLRTPSSVSEFPVWLLGVQYRAREESENQTLDALSEDFASRVWMTYRTGLAPIGTSKLTSDIGWGCTLRSGQMMLAQALQQHTVGRAWRRHTEKPLPETMCKLLRLFWDAPSSQNPLSIHNLCAAGKTHGVISGEWLGPFVLCHALQEAVNNAEPCIELRIHIVSQPGGAVPVLYAASFAELFQKSDAMRGSGDLGVIVLVPLLLGLGKINNRYLPQLQQILTWPQSIGIVGGRRSSSLYFVGFQRDQVIYLDPHQPQQISQPDEFDSHFCRTIHMMPMTSIDPSLAIGFHCQSLDCGLDLLHRLSDLEEMSEGGPLVSVIDGHCPTEEHDLDTREIAHVDGGWDLL